MRSRAIVMWRRWLVAALSCSAVAFACASEGVLESGPLDAPQVIAGEDAAGLDVQTNEAGRLDDAGVEAGNCSSDRVCLAATPLDGRASVTSVWGSGPTDVWAVGTAGLILHYDGMKWERADLEAQDAASLFTLRGVWLERPDDVWIVDGLRLRHSNGWTGPTTTTWEIYAYGEGSAIPTSIRGKNGTVWMARTPGLFGGSPLVKLGAWMDAGPGPAGDTLGAIPSLNLSAVAVGRDDEVWGVGSNRVVRARRTPPVKDGGPWTWPGVGLDSLTTRQLFALWVGESVVWLVGENGVIRRAPTSETPPLFDIVEAPSNADLYGVFGFGEDDVWAVGEAGTILHWDGAALTKLTTPLDDLPERPRLFAVWGSSPNDIWFAGAGVMLHLERSLP